MRFARDRNWLESDVQATNRFSDYSEFVLYGAIQRMEWLGYRRWAESGRTLKAAPQARPRGT
ncbi:MAG TPA: hypothetical protein VMP67_09870 [Candidatus Limnocylindria bacterium]|nr:hypothetical protein [Candidatus Limnocylindria bacterium]